MSLLKKNVIVIIGVLISNLLAFIFHFVAGRRLGPDAYGVFSALLAMLMIIAVPMNALNSTATKYSSTLIKANIRSLTALRKRLQVDILSVAGAVLLIMIIFNNWINDYLRLDNRWSLIMVVIAASIAYLLAINRGFSQGHRKYTQLSYSRIIEALSRVIFLVILIAIGTGAVGAFLAFGFGYLIAFLWLEYFRRRESTDEQELQIPRKEMYRFLFLVLIVQLTIQAGINLPTLYVHHTYSNEFTGYWNAALTISRMMLFATSAVSLVLFAETANSDSRKQRKKTFLFSNILILFGSLAIATAFYLAPEFFISKLYGPEYTEAASILKWMGFAMVFFSLLDLWSKYYLAKMK